MTRDFELAAVNLPLAFRDFRGTERSLMQPHLLFVDDEGPIRELVSIFFRKKGYEGTTATTGEEAMELADQKSYDVAILDIDLAGTGKVARRLAVPEMGRSKNPQPFTTQFA